ncbi:hypothetical protein QR680_012132 [Steinernema hermaphroditum]|uniref:CCHC-type domain-containing protein n=1 Tax=Steinernema hermaphroditum TaxID=289476 RepID=A0AA39LPM3_9BILA|nr:hypothetical protein QR680_001432 [Steinernema hermaphroditum]KAK0404958.1 hypothetical protein QR680_017722 [Steinernema hermaphroditum]KAK0411266.1 hypothetical protein QR680_005569 [Steinernema hermaphroditum]KAK0414922.1 hypothetical protein QR680_011678 [Steinernema hermaphroditum]KAK0415812.1 hypothetical protein QR680_012132 [Steinernema hermaphroditum]
MSHLPTSSAVVHDQEDVSIDVHKPVNLPMPLKTEGGARDTTERLLNVIARLESRLEAREAMPAATEKLKSARLNLQFALNADWINRLSQIEAGEDQHSLCAIIEDMKARNTVLRKGDAKPEFFTFFDNFREAEPDIPFAQCVSNALKKFNELEAIHPRQASSYLGRKRPFRQGGTSGGRPGTAFNQESGLVKQLCMQVNSLQQQVSAGYGYQAPPPRAPIRQSGPPFCFLCKGYGHFVKQCPQGPAGRQ